MIFRLFHFWSRGWSGGAKVLCILHNWGIQLILAYSWARPAILVVGKGEGECFYFFCFFTFIPVPLSSLSLSFISSTLSSISFLPFSGRRHKMTLKGWHVVKPQHNQSLLKCSFSERPCVQTGIIEDIWYLNLKWGYQLSTLLFVSSKEKC